MNKKYTIQYRFGPHDTFTVRVVHSREDFVDEIEYLAEIGAIDITVNVEE